MFKQLLCLIVKLTHFRGFRNRPQASDPMACAYVPDVQGVHSLPPADSSLPMVSSDVAAVLNVFKSRIQAESNMMQNAVATRNFQQLLQQANWVSEMGRAVGLEALAGPCAQLELATIEKNQEQIAKSLSEIGALVDRIHVPGDDRCNNKGDSVCSAKPVSNPLVSSLPMEYPEFRAIVMAFLPRLEKKLDEMEGASQRKDFKLLADLAHWLKGSGGTVGFPQFTEPAAKLEELANVKDKKDNIESVLSELRYLSGCIVVPDSPTSNSSPAVDFPMDAIGALPVPGSVSR